MHHTRITFPNDLDGWAQEDRLAVISFALWCWGLKHVKYNVIPLTFGTDLLFKINYFETGSHVAQAGLKLTM